MSRFLVTWEGEVEANTIADAAAEARRILWGPDESEFFVACIDNDGSDDRLWKADAITHLTQQVVP